jgi:aminocarboxymuconate-semialdehyde decarboxylase
MPVVDVHTHFIPDEFVEVLRAGAGPEGMAIVERDGREPLIAHDNGLRYPVLPEFNAVEAKLAQMDRDGIDVSVVSVSPTLFLYWASPQEALRTARLLNDAGRNLAAASDGRIFAMASVPMNDPVAAATELRRAHRELGAVGVEIGTCVEQVQLDDESLDPFYEAAAELAMPVMLHPYLSMMSAPDPGMSGFHLANVVGNPFETFVAAARMIAGGVFDRHPALRVQLVHAGGSLPFQLGRLEHAYEVRDETSAVARRRPTDYLENLLFDTIVFEPRSLDYLISLVGRERVLFGTDVPFDMADLSALEDRARLDPETAEAVLGANAISAYGLGARGV